MSKPKLSSIVKKIEKHAKAADPKVRRYENVPIGSYVHQGDLYLWRVPLGWARGTPWPLGKKLALGSGVGSTHYAECNAQAFTGTTAPKALKTLPRDCVGPVLDVVGPLVITHDEHAQHVVELAPDEKSCWQVTYQVDLRDNSRVHD